MTLVKGAFLGKMEHQERKEIKEHQGYRDCLGRKGTKDPQENAGLKDHQEERVNQESLELRDGRVIQESRAAKGFLE